jgi:hypothetical protein
MAKPDAVLRLPSPLKMEDARPKIERSSLLFRRVVCTRRVVL